VYQSKSVKVLVKKTLVAGGARIDRSAVYGAERREGWRRAGGRTQARRGLFAEAHDLGAYTHAG
jgi:hypothetical protein